MSDVIRNAEDYPESLGDQKGDQGSADESHWVLAQFPLLEGACNCLRHDFVVFSWDTVCDHIKAF